MSPAGPARLRVLHVLKSFGLGGTEKVAQLFLRHLDPERFETAAHSPEDGPRAAQIRAGGSATFVGQPLDWVLDTFRPHVVHVHRAGWPEPEFLRPIRGYAARRPVLVVETNVFGRHDPSPSGRVIDTHLFVSRFCSRRFMRHTGILPRWPAYGVLYNPVDTDFFREALPDGPRPQGPVLGRISRPDPGKWSPMALGILPLLAQAVPGFRCRMVGAIPEARTFVEQHGLGACVEFLPALTTDAELAKFYGGLAALAHANDAGESFGLVIAEAMACGLPVVTHPSLGDRDNAQLELVEHCVTGLVARNIREYAGAVLWLFEHPQEAAELGRAGRDKAVRLFRAQDAAARLGAMYLDLLARKGLKADA